MEPLPSELVVDVLSASRRAVYDPVGFVRQSLRNALCRAPPDLVIVEVQAKRPDGRMIRKELRQSHGYDLLPFLLEHPRQGKKGVPLPVPACAILQRGIAEQVDGGFKDMER